MAFLFSWRGAFLTGAIASVLFLVACNSGSFPSGDGGVLPTDGAVAPTALLESVTEANVGLLFGEEHILQVVYRETDGRPIVGADVEFALVGRANDSSLSHLTAQTDALGEASIQVMAGSSPSAFSVRVSAPRAAPILIGVAVNDAGFGALDVSIEWAGTRPIVSHRIGIYTGTTCDDQDAIANEPDRVRNLNVDEEVASFLALPAGLVYAVTAAGLSEGGDTVATGCLDHVAVSADDIATAVVPVADLPLETLGEYSVQVGLDTLSEGEAISRAISRSGRAPVDAAGGDAPFLLDALEESLRDGGDDTNAGLIAAERARSMLDEGLLERLVMIDVGPSRAVDGLAATLPRRIETITIEGRVHFSDTDPTFVVDTTFGTGSDPSLPRLVVPVAAFPRPLEGRLSFTPMPADDLISLDELGADLPLGSFARGAVMALGAETGATDLAALLEARGGCATMQIWASEIPVISTACDDMCVLAICKGTLTGLASAIDMEFGRLDLSRSDLSLRGVVDATDNSGDLRIDHFSTDSMVGRYSNADGTAYDDITASVAGVSIIE